jgi:hypothetical protein
VSFGDYYDRAGSPITFEAFADLHSDPEYIIVAKKQFEGSIEVSTCWLGINHQFGAGEPLIFETMIFAGDRYPYSEATERYPTLEQAEEGHRRTCADVEAGRRPWFFDDE